MDEWFTLESAARHLGVSTRTLRRWIKAGRLDARLQPGPYGQQYLVPGTSLAGVQVVRDVERAEREAERESVPAIVEEYLRRRESPLAAEIASLRQELGETMRRLQSQNRALLDRLEAVQAELRELRGPQQLPAAPGSQSSDE